MTTVPNPEFLNDRKTPTIALAGTQWPIPPLAAGRNRIAVPKLLSLAPKLFGAFDPTRKAFDLTKFGDALTEENYAKLLDVVYIALLQAHRNLRREEFEEWPISTSELVLAFTVIAQQTGIIRPAKSGETGSVGEGTASPQTAGGDA